MSKKFYGPKIVLSCFLIMFAATGAIATFALFIPEFCIGVNASINEITLMVTTNCIGVVLGGVLATKAFEKIGLKKSALAGLVCLALHFTIYATTYSLVMLYIAAFIGGIGMAMGTVACCSGIVNQWYIKDFEKKLGIASSGMGIGAAVFTIIAGQMITWFGYRVAYGVQIAILLVIGLPAILAIKMPEQLNQKPYGIDEIGSEENDFSQITGVTAKELYKKVSFWFIVLGMIGIGCLNINFESYIGSYWQLHGMSVATTSVYFAVYMTLGALLTSVGGVIAEKLKAKLFTVYLVAMFVIGIISIIRWGSNQSMLWMCLMILGMSASYPLLTTIQGVVVADCYGNVDFTKVCSIVTTAYYAGQMLAPIEFSLFMGATEDYGKGFTAQIIIALLAVVCIILGAVTSPYKKHSETNP